MFDVYAQKDQCENTFRAIMNAMLASSACDITGKVAFACARHGCYAPNSLVDLYKGEQQKNVDFAFLKALETTKVVPEQGVMIIYDIACQYMVHLRERIGHGLPAGLHIDSAIGLFHVHAHKDECLFRYATSFIPGAAVTAGEILESLWSALNGISPVVRTATLAHRAEVLDDHACDNNHKKMLGIVRYLCRRHSEATITLLDARKYMAHVANPATPEAIAEWTRAVEAAEQLRHDNVKVMDIYKARIAKEGAGTEAELSDRPQTATERWLEFAMVVEEKRVSRWQPPSCLDHSLPSLGWPSSSKSGGSNASLAEQTFLLFRTCG